MLVNFTNKYRNPLWRGNSSFSLITNTEEQENNRKTVANQEEISKVVKIEAKSLKAIEVIKEEEIIEVIESDGEEEVNAIATVESQEYEESTKKVTEWFKTCQSITEEESVLESLHENSLIDPFADNASQFSSVSQINKRSNANALTSAR